MPAINVPHSVLRVPVKFIKPVGMVLILSFDVNIIAIINSFQQYIADINAEDANIGLHKGIMILLNTPNEVHPSIYAASSNDAGRPRKYALINITVKAMLYTEESLPNKYCTNASCLASYIMELH